MIDFGTEQVLTFVEATKLLPRRRRGKKPSASTLYRWASIGLRGVKLETLRVGGSLCTSVKAMQRFFDRLGEAEAPHCVPEAKIAKSRRIGAVEDELEQLGL